MGPRQKSLGNSASLQSWDIWTLELQWGRGKKASEIVSWAEQHGSIPRFNGAEAKKPRKFVCIIIPQVTLLTLQWGRGKKASEIRLPVSSVSLMIPLQWGRGKKASEIHATAIIKAKYSMLQWGRGKKASEIKTHGITPTGKVCFNGAEAKKPRKL